eukprot:4218840-Alexandrium_andersonii.AAC.1
MANRQVRGVRSWQWPKPRQQGEWLRPQAASTKRRCVRILRGVGTELRGPSLARLRAVHKQR